VFLAREPQIHRSLAPTAGRLDIGIAANLRAGWTAISNPAVPSCAKDGTTRVGVDAKNGCEGGGSAFECYDFSPWYDAGTNMAYGFAAYNGVSCGTCFKFAVHGQWPFWCE